MRVVLIYTLGWLGLVILAILNGSVRQLGYGPRLGELRAHQLSTLIGLLVFTGYLALLSRVRPIRTAGQAITIGALWLGLTVLFEFGFGHYVAGHPWTRLLADYNLFEGRVWVLVLVWCAVAPWLAYRLR